MAERVAQVNVATRIGRSRNAPPGLAADGRDRRARACHVGGTPRLLLGRSPHEIEEARWDASAAEIFVKANMGVRSELFRVNVRANRATQLTDAVHTVTDWWYAAKDEHGSVIRADKSPSDVHLLEGTRLRLAP